MLIEEACGIAVADLMVAARSCEEGAFWAPEQTPCGVRIEPTAGQPTAGQSASVSNGVLATTSRGGREPDQDNMIRRLLPHMRQFNRIRDALAGARALSASFADLLDNSLAGVICVDRRGRVVQANSVASALLRNRKGLMQDRDGCLRARFPADDARLRRLLARALTASPAPGAHGHTAIQRSPGVPPLLLRVAPVVAHGAGLERSRIASTVLIVDAAAKRVVDPKDVAAPLGLTLAESEVACSAADGATAREIAAVTGRRESTVRELLKRVHVKLGISRRADLVRAVLSISAFGPPLDADDRPEPRNDGDRIGGRPWPR